MTQDEMKLAVAKAAIQYIPDDSIVGVGTGSTANFFIDELAKIKGRIEGTVASSEATRKRLEGHGIKVFDLNEVSDIPVYVDGADEIDAGLNMIKGGGAALTREKIVAAMSEEELVPKPVLETMFMASKTSPSGAKSREFSSSSHSPQAPLPGSGISAVSQSGRKWRMRLLAGSFRSMAVIIE